MHTNIDHEVAALGQMTTGALQAKYAELFGEATQVSHKAWLVRRIAWRLQALAEGDLSERARRRAAELANDADLRLAPPRAAHNGSTPLPAAPIARSRRDRRLPRPGTLLTRRYKGQTVQVQVLAEGFSFADKIYPSLSAVAQAITGAHWNGFHFFQLRQTGESQ